MPKASIAADRSLVLVGRERGLSIIPRPTPLTRLRYFDGKFLRAADLELEQRYHRELVAQSNRAGGSGVVHGFDCTLAGGALTVGAGLAIDPEGRVLLLPEERKLSLADLIQASRSRAGISAAPPSSSRRLIAAGFEDCVEAVADDGGAVAEGTALHLVVAFHAEALCGEEDVYGKLCEEACVTSTERPYVVEGVVIRAVPLDLVTALATSTAVTLTRKHLRSRVASAFFEDERRAVASLISRQGLGSEAWCRGAVAAAGSGVPLALIARAGSDTLYLDAWTARRERIEPPPRRHWARVLAMRPWDVFLAQVLQFQCQLRSALDAVAEPGGEDDPCADAHRLLADASAGIERVLRGVAEERASAEPATRREAETGDREAELRFREAAFDVVGASPRLKNLDAIRSRLAAAAEAFFTPATERLLIEGGIVELPPAGYLPVLPDSPVGVERQVRQLLGDGLDLRFCAVRPDFVPHALEEAQHMERISLTAGLDAPEAKPKVDVLVPDGVFEERAAVAPGVGYETRLRIEPVALSLFSALFGAPAPPATGVGAVPNLLVEVSPLFREATGGQPRAAFAFRPQPIPIFGAARGEALPGGGSACHLAGRTPVSRRPFRPADLATAVGETAEVVRPRTAAFNRAAAFDRQLVELSPVARLRALDPLTEPKAGLSVFEPEERPASLWATLRADRDPFGLPLHGSAEVSAEIALLHPATQPRRVRRLHFAGTLSVEQRRSLPRGGIGLAARLSGFATVTEPAVDAPTSATASVRLDDTIQLERASGERGTVCVALPGARLWPAFDVRFEATVERSWPAADQAEVKSELSIVGREERLSFLATADKEVRPPVFAAEQTVDAAVLAPGNPAHDASLAALEAIGGALGDAGFAAAAARKLFPPPDPATEPAVLRATRDWVLFHRRRDKDCGTRADPAARLEARRYRLFHVGLREPAEVEILGKLLASGRTLPNFAPRPVGAVEFGAGIQAVQTPHDEVRTDWSALMLAEAEIVYGSIASTGAAFDEGEPLARARLGTLAHVLAPLAARAAGAPLETLPSVPAALAPGDGDGVILFATVGVALACNEVYRAELTEDQVERLVAAAQQKRLAEVLKEIGALRLGQAGFRGGTAEPFGPGIGTVLDAWRRAGDGAVAQVLAFTAAGSADEVLALAAGQAARIAAAAGGGGADPDPQLLPLSSALGPCPVVTVLVVRPAPARTCHSVLMMQPTTQDRVRPAAELITRDLGAFFIRNRAVSPLGEVEFLEGSEEPIAESLEPAVATWRQIFGGTDVSQGFAVAGVVVSRPGSGEEIHQRHRKQAANVLTALGDLAAIEGVIPDAGTFPVECEALTLVFPLTPETRSVVPVVVDQPAVEGRPRVRLAPRFDAEGELIRDEAFEREVEALRAEDTRFVRLAFAASERPQGTDRRLTSLFDALREAGVVTSDARRSTRTLKSEDRRELERRVGATVAEVLILEVE